MNLTVDDFQDILDTAGYGIGYWASKAVVTNQSYKVVEDETDEVFVITKKKLETVIHEVLDHKYKIAECIVNDLKNDVAAIDAESADAVIQLCCFGEIVYG